MHKGFFKTAALLGAFSVALGAFAAHTLSSNISEQAVTIFETAVRYQFYHAIALMITSLVWKEYRNKWIAAAGTCFIIGIIFFSGSLYILTYKTAVISNGFKWAGPLTPFGGLFFIAGWACLFAGCRNKKIQS
ncbi:MAG: hypothetical protein JWN76_835 [Chitinophagaceae bacterium]|nr:hypothetical protein [Chitinophagaceae bacterium]